MRVVFESIDIPLYGHIMVKRVAPAVNNSGYQCFSVSCHQGFETVVHLDPAGRLIVTLKDDALVPALETGEGV